MLGQLVLNGKHGAGNINVLIPPRPGRFQSFSVCLSASLFGIPGAFILSKPSQFVCSFLLFSPDSFILSFLNGLIFLKSYHGIK